AIDVSSDGVPAYYHPGRSARSGDLVVFGELHPEYAALFKLRSRVYLAEFDAEKLLALESRRQVQPLPRFPAIRRDFSLLLDKGTQYGTVRQMILESGIPELVRVEPFDRMEEGALPAGKYSLAVSVVYQSPERTLTDAEVEAF